MDKIFQEKKIHFKLSWFIACSLFLHAAILVSKTSTMEFFKPSEKSDEHIVKLRLLNNYKNKIKKQIVQTEQTYNNEKADSAFLGKNNNKVARQTRAANTGKFKSAGVGRRNGSLSKSKTTKNLTKKMKNLNFSDIGYKANKKDYSEKKFKKISQAARKGLRSGSHLSKGLGQSNDFLEDIPLGDFTKLNTQEFEFYGFYNRIREKLEQFWGRNIQDQADKIMKSGRSLASDANHITALEIELNSLGEIVKVDVKSASGIRELDSAAIETFNQAGPFPNPPSKMLKSGRAKIKWSFVVNT